MTPLTDKNFYDEVVAQPLPAIVLFGSSDCPRFLALRGSVATLALCYGGRVKLATADIAQARAAAQANGIRDLPAAAVFVNGEVIFRFSGQITPLQLGLAAEARIAR